MRLFLAGFSSIYYILGAFAFYVCLFQDAFGNKEFGVFLAGTICGGYILIIGLVVAAMVLKP